jgi:hypothetical protein
MNRGNLNGFEVRKERTFRTGKIGKFRTGKIGKDASTTSAPWVPRISHEILRDLGMSDDSIARYFCRFRHGQLEQSVQMVLRKRGWTSSTWRGHMSNEGAVS